MQGIEGIGTFDAAVERKFTKDMEVFMKKANSQQETSSEIGLCKCGCGKPVGTYAYTDKRKGYIRGQYKQFIVGHHPRTSRSTLGDILEGTIKSRILEVLATLKVPVKSKTIKERLKDNSSTVYAGLKQLKESGQIKCICTRRKSQGGKDIFYSLVDEEEIENLPPIIKIRTQGLVVNALSMAKKPMNAKELALQIKTKEANIWGILARLSKKGLLNKEGKGSRVSPFYYSVNTELVPIVIIEKTSTELKDTEKIMEEAISVPYTFGLTKNIINALATSDVPMSANELQAHLKAPLNNIFPVLTKLSKSGIINKEGIGKKHNSYYYFINTESKENFKSTEPVLTRKEFIDSITQPQPVPDIIHFWKKEFNDFSLLYEGDVLENLVNIETSSSSYINLDPPFNYDRALFPDWINKIALEVNRIATPECNLSIVLPDDMLDIAMDKFKARGWKLRNFISLQKCNVARDKKRDESPKNDGKMGQAAFFCALMYKGDIENVYFKKLGNVKVYENSHVCDECGNKQNREVWLGGNVWSHTAGHSIAGHHHKQAMPEYQTHALIEMLSQGGDLVLDVFNGSGNMMIYCMFNNRGCIGIELDPEAIEHYRIRLDKKLEEQRQRYERKSK